MKSKKALSFLVAGVLLSSWAVSNASAEDMRWVNLHDFIGGENTIITSSTLNPGSILVSPDDNTLPHEIITQFKIKKDYELTSIQVCLRNDLESTPPSPFGVEILNLGSPLVMATGTTVDPDVSLLTAPAPSPLTDECSVIAIDPAIQATDETKLLSIYFEEGEGYEPATISAVGLGETPLYVMIDECNSYVPDVELDGTTLSEMIDECAVNAKNHGKYVSCVTKTANNFKKQKLITGRQKGKITKCAAKSSIPK